MTPAQQAALEGLMGRTFAETEVADIAPLVDARNDAAVAGALTASQPPRRVSIRVEDVFNVLYASGDYVTIKQAELAGNPLAVLAFAFLRDAKQIGPGMVNLDAPATIAQFDALQSAGLLSQVGRAALDGAGWEPGYAVQINHVSDVLNRVEAI